MILANHKFARRQLNVLDEYGREGCARCGRPRDLHPDAATFVDFVEVLAHRVLARHAPYEMCSECPQHRWEGVPS